jgi:Domain of unknown function (DUF5666)
MQIIRCLAAIALLILPATAFAHGGGEHVMGTVKAVDAGSLTVETMDKKEVKVILGDKTRFEKDGVPASAKDLTVGARVVVHTAKGTEAGDLFAVVVKFGDRSKADPPPKP